MENYQLKRTNVLLGGQMKYDLIISKDVINDIHITPISDSVAYNRYVKEDLLNYSHAENIKNYYNKIASSFYQDFADKRLTSIYPLPNEYQGPQIITTYDAGCKIITIPEQQIYGHQIEVLCPVWIEKITDITKLRFELHAKYKSEKSESNTDIFVHTVRFDNQLNNPRCVGKYFNQYIQFLKLDQDGCDWILDINDKICIVNGLDVQTGLCKETKLYNFYYDITSRERPLLEVNNMFINELNKNHLICKQLFNFNLCFKYGDVFNPVMLNVLNDLIQKNEIIFEVKVYEIDPDNSNKTYYKHKELFTNHSYIDKPSIKPSKLYWDEDKQTIAIKNTSIGKNVLDYLQDYRFINFIDKNKMIQNTCHWCLSDNPVQHFNFYDGWSPAQLDDDKNIIEAPYCNGETADLYAINFSNNIYPFWCNTYNTDADFIGTILYRITTGEFDEFFSKFSSDCWVKNIHYKTNTKYDEIKVVAFICNSSLETMNNNMGNISTWTKINTGTVLPNISIWMKDNNIIIFVANNNMGYRDLLYKNFISKLKKINSSNTYINNLLVILSKPDLTQQRTIQFQNSIIPIHAESPSPNSKELYYLKSTTVKTIIRQMGKIKPFFIEPNDIYINYQYKKLKLEELRPVYQKYANTNFTPVYPSIDYYAFAKINEIN